ncbi:Unknown protein [Striga hermonthica]|uniref:DUF1985 domain-containing protein n=1 Tax=Striga hermonthica TaxID=68872 RepID=A0A9N7NQW2_STRHE|nr:Unknown protein [Striga hermonthica]
MSKTKLPPVAGDPPTPGTGGDPHRRSSTRIKQILARDKSKLIQKKLDFEKNMKPTRTSKEVGKSRHIRQSANPDSDDFQSDHGEVHHKDARRTQKRKISNVAEAEESRDPNYHAEDEMHAVVDDSEYEDEQISGMKFSKKKKDGLQEGRHFKKKRTKDSSTVGNTTGDCPIVKEWELIIPNPRDLNVKVLNSNDNSRDDSTISEIKRMLSAEQLDLFRESAFGKFLDLPHCKVQNQLVNQILLREVHQSRSDELWLDFGGRFFRFGIEEFALITGLKCTGPCKKLNIPQVHDGMYDKFFSGVGLNRNFIRWQFLQKYWKSDEDAVKFAKLHLLANFLIGSQDTLKVDRCYLDMIDSADCDDFDWGTEVFEFTMHHLKKSTQYRKQIHKAGKPVTGGYLYRCYGFILALQLWFYEVCTSADGVICTCLSENDMPRMLKWEVRGSHNRAFMQRIFSNLDSSKFKNVIPTDEEKHTLFINDFFKSKNEFNRDEIPTTDHHQQKSEADVIKRLDRLTHEVETLKQIFLDFSNRVFAEFALFKEKFNQMLEFTLNLVKWKKPLIQMKEFKWSV